VATTFFLGLDLGKVRDPSSIVGVEMIPHRRAFQPTPFEMLVVRLAETMPLGTPYPKVVERTRDITQCGELKGNCALAVDGTGVGGPVVDMLRAARLGCSVTEVTLTGGERGSGEAGYERASVPKRDLFAGIQVLLEMGQLKIGNVKEAPRLMQELMDVRMSMNGSGHVRLGAEGTGQHDDMVVALGLACWRATRRTGTCGERGQRLI